MKKVAKNVKKCSADFACFGSFVCCGFVSVVVFLNIKQHTPRTVFKTKARTLQRMDSIQDFTTRGIIPGVGCSLRDCGTREILNSGITSHG